MLQLSLPPIDSNPAIAPETKPSKVKAWLDLQLQQHVTVEFGSTRIWDVPSIFKAATPMTALHCCRWQAPATSASSAFPRSSATRRLTRPTG